MSVPPLPNPFNDVQDELLYDMMTALTFSCLKSKASMAQEHKKYVCALLAILEDQARKRPAPIPRFPFPPHA